jgi:hypothetical protein
MSSGIDYIPKGNFEFKGWVTLFIKALGAKLDQLHFPPEVYATLTALNDDFAQKFKLATTPATRTAPAVLEKDQARNALKKAVRQAVKEYLTYNHLLTDGERNNLGLPIHKATHTRAPVATSYPHFEIDTHLLRHLTIHFYDEGKEKSKARPAGQLGAEIVWAIRDTPPANIADLIHSSLDPHSPFTLEFEGHERGKTVYFCLCWINTHGQKGPWSQIKNAIVP